jgi:hypothetical protein
MRDVTGQNFGLLIAYVLPGLTALWGVSFFSDTVRSWLNGPGSECAILNRVRSKWPCVIRRRDHSSDGCTTSPRAWSSVFSYEP